MPATTSDKMADTAAHVEAIRESHPPAGDTGLVLNDHELTLDSDVLRDQMAAQVKATRIKFTSMASVEMCFYLFVAYCSKSTVPSIFLPWQPANNSWQTLGVLDSTAL